MEKFGYLKHVKSNCYIRFETDTSTRNSFIYANAFKDYMKASVISKSIIDVQMILYRALALNRCYFKHDGLEKTLAVDISKDKFTFVECEIQLKEETVIK